VHDFEVSSRNDNLGMRSSVVEVAEKTMWFWVEITVDFMYQRAKSDVPLLDIQFLYIMTR
jgi:hypothetical protein